LGAEERLINEVCDIIGHHHHPRDQETANFKILYDADLIVNLEDKHGGDKDLQKLTQIIEKAFLTESARELARTVLLEKDSR
jgi:hypothetical protein